jgi:hypothetical protein
MQAGRQIMYDPRSVDVISGKFMDSDGNHKDFYYRFRTASTQDHPGQMVKMFEHILPEVSPDHYIYWNVNQILSGSFFNYGASNTVDPSCTWPELSGIRSAGN